MTDINNFSVNRSTPNDLVWDDETNEYVSSSDMYKVIRIDTNTFSENKNIVSIDLHNIPWVNNSMFNAFYNFKNLTSVANIPNSIINMAEAFSHCSNLEDAPSIPHGVTNLYNAFAVCTNLVNAPVIPNTVINLCYTFYATHHKG